MTRKIGFGLSGIFLATSVMAAPIIPASKPVPAQPSSSAAAPAAKPVEEKAPEKKSEKKAEKKSEPSAPLPKAAAPAVSSAAPSTSTSALPLQESVKLGLDDVNPEAKKKWGITLGLDAESSLHYWNDVNHAASLYITTVPSWQWNDSFKSSFVLVTRQDLEGERDVFVHKATLGLSWAGTQLNPFLKFSSGLSFGLPLSKDRRVRESYITGISLTPKLDLNLKQVGIHWLSGSYTISPARLIHSYRENTTGTSNNQYSLTNVPSVSITFSDKLSFTSSYEFVTSWTYAGNQKNSFAWNQSLDFQASEKVGLNASFGTSGTALKDNGVDSAISFYDSEKTSVSLGVSVSI